MTVRSGPSWSCRVLSSSHMSCRSSPGRWDTATDGTGVEEDRICRSTKQGLSCGGTSGQAWSSILVHLLVFTSTFPVLAHAQDRETQNREIYNSTVATLNSVKIKTGFVYNVSLSTITDKSVELVQMVRLRSGSLKRYGIRLNEITLPQGMKVDERLRYVILVYRRFSEYRYYNATVGGEVFVAPVVGILAYNSADAANYTGVDMQPQMTIDASDLPILVQFQSPENATNNVNCVMYNNTINGTTIMADVKNLSAPESPCSWSTLGDYSLVGPRKKKSSNTWKIALGSVATFVFSVLLLPLVVVVAVRYREKAKFANMENKSEEGERLQHTSIGGSRAPAAAGTRTKPILENDYVC